MSIEEHTQDDIGNDTAAIQVVRPRRWEHWPVATVAVLIGLICGLPHVLMSVQLAHEGKTYAPLVPENVSALTYDETTYYAVRIRDVIDGHILSGDAAGLEHKEDRPFLGQSWLDTVVSGTLGLVMGRSVPAVFVFGDFVFPPLCFLLLFAICRRLGAPQWVAIAAGALSIIAHDQVTLPIAFAAGPSLGLLADRLHLFSSVRPIEFCRLTVPQLSFIPLAGAILGLLSIYEQPRPRRAILTGLVIGALIYCYVFYWTFLVAGGVILLLASSLHRGGRRAVPMLATALGVGLLIGLPVILQLLTPDGFAGRDILMTRQSWGGRHIRWGYQKYDLALLFVLLAFYPKRRREFTAVVAFLVAPFLCVFAARVAGMGVQEWHWLGRCWQPWSAVTVVLMLWAWTETLRTWLQDRAGEPSAREGEIATNRRWALGTSIVFGILAGLTLLYAANDHVRFSRQMASCYTLPREEIEGLRQLQLRTPADSVVMCLDASLQAMVPVLTHCNVYLPYCLVSPMGNPEVIDRTALVLGAYGLSEGDATRLLAGPSDGNADDRALFTANRTDLPNWLFHRTLPGGGIPPEAEREIKAKAAFYGPDGFRDAKWKYQVDFIIWGPLERKLGDPAIEKNLADRLFIDSGEFKVYRATAPGPAPKFIWPRELPPIQGDEDAQDPLGSDPQVGGADADTHDDRPGAGVDGPDSSVPEP